jgi:perosamine synthetase
MIPLSVPELRGREWEYVKDCLDTGWVSSVGSYVGRFEEACAAATGTRYAVATVNGTSALHVALLVAGVEPDDEVLVSTLTFIAPVNAIRYAGAWPVLVDAEPEFWQLDVGLVEQFLTEGCDFDGTTLRNKTTGRRVRAIVPVDVLGHPVDLAPILNLAERFGLAVVEDATESLGASYRGAPVGSRAPLACLSFNGNKLVTTGGGGMIVTNDATFERRARHLTTQAKADPLEYIHDEIGYNYRLTNVLAAIGCAQMESLDGYVAIKRANAVRYRAAFAEIPGIEPMREAAWAAATFWLFTILVDERAYGMGSRELLRQLELAGIQARPLWQPMHRSPVHAGSQVLGGTVADGLYERALSLPSSVGLTREQGDAVIGAIRDAARVGTGS